MIVIFNVFYVRYIDIMYNNSYNSGQLSKKDHIDKEAQGQLEPQVCGNTLYISWPVQKHGQRASDKCLQVLVVKS